MKLQKHKVWFLPVFSGLLLTGFWYLVGYVYAQQHGYNVQKVIIPFPHQIFEAILKEHEVLLSAMMKTAWAALLGFVSAVTVGYLIAMVLASAVWVKQSLYPWVLVLQMTPVVILAPIFALWIGQGLPSITLVTFMIGFFPVVANTTMGLVSTDNNLLNLFKMCNASKIQEVFFLRVPYSMPYFLTGMKIAGTLAPIGAITGDIFAGSYASGEGGLGFLTIIFNSQLKIDALYATAFTACLLGFIFVGTVNLLHWYLLKNWHESMISKET